MTDVCKALSQTTIASASSEPETVQEIVAVIPSLKRFLEGRAKKGFIDDLTRFNAALEPFAQFAILDVSNEAVARLTHSGTPGGHAAKLSLDMANTYLHDLEAALGDEVRFPEVFNKLKKDKSMRAPELKKLAKNFTGARETTKEGALGRILERHESLIGTAARAKATGGRTTAWSGRR